MSFNAIETLTLSGLVIFAGYGVRRLVPVLGRVNIPAPVIGGMLVAVLNTILRAAGLPVPSYDTSIQMPLVIAFFTSVGFGASFSLLKKGGHQIVFFLVVSTVFAVLQNAVGIGLAVPMGQHPLFGVMCSSVTLTGGPATGLAFAPRFESAGLNGAAAIAITAAMCGIVSGGLVGAPAATWIIERYGLRSGKKDPGRSETPDPRDVVEQNIVELPAAVPESEDREYFTLLKSLVVILAAMWCGSWISAGFTRLDITLPAYIGAMIAGIAFRNLDDIAGAVSLSQKTIDDIGAVALSIFISMSLMTLRLWEIASLALPIAVIVAAQIVLVVTFCLPIYRLFGRDYDAAVMSGGFVGFMLGTTANAMANMNSLADRYGPAPRAFLVVPMVGAFFIDITNALIITAFINFFK